MIIIWTRWGILVLPVIGAALGTGAILSSAVAPLARHNQSVNNLCLGLGLIIGGLYIYGLHYALHRWADTPQMLTSFDNESGMVVPIIDARTGEPVMLARSPSTLFWIPVQFWAYIVPGIGCLIVLHNAFTLAST